MQSLQQGASESVLPPAQRQYQFSIATWYSSLDTLHTMLAQADIAAAEQAAYRKHIRRCWELSHAFRTYPYFTNLYNPY